MNLLADHRFTVASYGVAAGYAAWLLREFGAAVRHETALDPEALGAFLGQGAAFAATPALNAAGADVFITDVPVDSAARSNLERLSRQCRVIWITPWGLGTDWDDAPGTDLQLHAAGGWMSAVGDPGKEPIGPPGAQGRFMTGLYATIEALRPFAQPNSMGHEPGLSVVSAAEAVAATMIYDYVGFQYRGQVRERAGNRFSAIQTTLATLAVKDGHVGLHAALHSQWVLLCGLIGHPELASDPRFADPVSRSTNVAELDREYLLPWLSQRTRKEAFRELQAAGIPASWHPDMREVLDSAQLAARDAWRDVVTPRGRRVRVPGPPARVIGTAPHAGDEVANGPWAPGRLRVVDLSMGWAGPMVSYVLSSFGADVIKVEGPKRFDWWRGSRPPADAPTQLHEFSHVFNSVNRGKRGVAFELTTQRGCELLLELVSTADVLVENFRADVLEKLGLDFDTVTRRNPALVVLRQPAWGATGPDSGLRAFGNTIEGMSGLTSLMGYEAGPPMMMSNALGDPVSGLTGTVAVLAGLAARRRDGKGRWLEAAQLEGFLPFVSESLIAYQQNGIVPSRRGNRRGDAVPSGVFPCAGDDEWVAIEARDDAEWSALARIVGDPWAADGGLAALAGRVAAAGAVEQRLAAWTRTRDRALVVDALRGAGVPAAPVNSEADLLSAEPFQARGFFNSQERAFVGMHLYPSLPTVSDGVRHQPPRPAPVLGEHNEEVLAGMGWDGDAIAVLAETAVIGGTLVAV